MISSCPHQAVNFHCPYDLILGMQQPLGEPFSDILYSNLDDLTNGDL